MNQLFKDIAIVAFCSILVGIITYMKGYTKGYDEAKESYSDFYEKLIKIKDETYESKLKYYENRN